MNGTRGISKYKYHLSSKNSCCQKSSFLGYIIRCRRKLVGSLRWGISTVVVYRQTCAQATNLMVTQDTDKDFIQVRPLCGRNTYVLRLIVLLCVELNYLRGSLASLYIVQRAGLHSYNCHR